MIQLQTLNYLLNTKDKSIVTTNALSSEFFSDYKEEFNFILNHINEYGKIPDKESFMVKFPQFDIIEVNEPKSYLLTELYKDRNTRLLAARFNQIRKLISEKKIDEAMQVYSKANEDIGTATCINSVDIFDDTTRYDRFVERSSDYTKAYVTTGFKELDNIIGGWNREEEYATIVARPGIGKTWCLLKTALAAAEHGLVVGIYSGEMSADSVGYRLDSLFSHISNKQLIRGEVSVQNDYKKYLDNLKTTMKGTIRILTPDMIGGPAGVSALRSFIERDKLDMLCIDQHSLLEDDRHAKNPIDRASNISKDIKNLQVMTRIPIITVSQQNREKSEQGVNSSLVAQSDRIGQDSTVVLFVEQKDNVMTLTLAKSRYSESNKKLQYMVDLNRGMFTYLPSESDGLKGSTVDDLKSEYDGDLGGGEDVF